VGNPYDVAIADLNVENRLTGRLTFTDPVNQPGFSIGSSRITVVTITQNGRANGTTTQLTFTLGSVASSDLTLNADTQHIDIHTTGYYQATLLQELDSATATDVEINVFAPTGFGGWNMAVGSALPDTGTTLTLTLPIIPILAGQQINANVLCDVAGHAGTYDVSSAGQLDVVRLA
jgi:hypothetical protein